MENILSEKELKEFRKLLDDCTKVVISAHVGPDGDAIGSEAERQAGHSGYAQHLP